jgi:hypothetical protein
MHVPEPVISLAIRPQGQETPNFARALNRFRKEDPTFKIHFDNDSKEVRIVISSLVIGSPTVGRLLYQAWANSISKFTSSA